MLLHSPLRASRGAGSTASTSSWAGRSPTPSD